MRRLAADVALNQFNAGTVSLHYGHHRHSSADRRSGVSAHHPAKPAGRGRDAHRGARRRLGRLAPLIVMLKLLRYHPRIWIGVALGLGVFLSLPAAGRSSRACSWPGMAASPRSSSLLWVWMRGLTAQQICSRYIEEDESAPGDPRGGRRSRRSSASSPSSSRSRP